MKNTIIATIIFGLCYTTSFSQLSDIAFENALKINATVEAHQFLEHILELDQKYPVDAKISFLRATYQYRIGKFEDAQKSFTKSIAQDSTYALYYVGRASIHALNKKFGLALSDLSEAIKHEPRNAKIYDIRIQILVQLGKIEAAIRDVEAKIILKPMDLSNYVLAADLCVQINKSNKAEMYFAKAFSTYGIDTTAVDLAYSQFLINMQRYDDAIFRYLDAIQKNAKLLSAVDYNNIAVAYCKLQNYTAAMKFVNLAMKLSQHNLEYKSNYVAILAAKKEWKKVIEVSKNILLLDYNHKITKDFLAIALLKTEIAQTSTN